MAVLAAASSQALVPIDPQTALTLDPFNNDARIETLSQGLSDVEPASPEYLISLAELGTRLNPSDGRFLSLKGLAELKAGNNDEAQSDFVAALSILPTEIQALYNRFFYLLSQGDHAGALKNAVMIARRWPEFWPRLEPWLPAMLATPESVEDAARTFGADPVGRSRLIGSLTKVPANLELAKALIEQWKLDGLPLREIRPLSNSVSNNLFTTGEYTSAYFLFRSMLDAEHQKVTGYVHNSGFTIPPTASVFDWRIGSQPGATVSLTANGLEVRFRDSPLQFSSLQQMVRLPLGKFQLEVTYSTLDLVTPKPMQVGLSCIGSRKELASIVLDSGSVAKTTATVAFEVPAANCPILRLRLFNEFLASSWNNRYNGSLVLHNIGITRAAAGDGGA